nr:acetyl-coenzyme A synthetase [Actinomycetota bacterium]
MSAPEDQQPTIEDLYLEERSYPPPDDFKKRALVTGAELYDEADQDYQGFWAREADDLLDWAEDWHTILEWNLPFAKWFVGGKLNVAHNCVDRHVDAGNGERVAFYWEGEPGDRRTITYAELQKEVSN